MRCLVESSVRRILRLFFYDVLFCRELAGTPYVSRVIGLLLLSAMFWDTHSPLSYLDTSLLLCDLDDLLAPVGI